MTELLNGDLVLDNGTLISAEKRTRCEVFSRIVGYLRPIAQWNKGKKAEWADRVNFDEKQALEDAKQRLLKEATHD